MPTESETMIDLAAERLEHVEAALVLTSRAIGLGFETDESLEADVLIIQEALLGITGLAARIQTRIDELIDVETRQPPNENIPRTKSGTVLDSDEEHGGLEHPLMDTELLEPEEIQTEFVVEEVTEQDVTLDETYGSDDNSVVIAEQVVAIDRPEIIAREPVIGTTISSLNQTDAVIDTNTLTTSYQDWEAHEQSSSQHSKEHFFPYDTVVLPGGLLEVIEKAIQKHKPGAHLKVNNLLGMASGAGYMLSSSEIDELVATVYSMPEIIAKEKGGFYLKGPEALPSELGKDNSMKQKSDRFSRREMDKIAKVLNGRLYQISGNNKRIRNKRAYNALTRAPCIIHVSKALGLD